jgi:hypothetical protein
MVRKPGEFGAFERFTACCWSGAQALHRPFSQ